MQRHSTFPQLSAKYWPDKKRHHEWSLASSRSTSSTTKVCGRATTSSTTTKRAKIGLDRTTSHYTRPRKYTFQDKRLTARKTMRLSSLRLFARSGPNALKHPNASKESPKRDINLARQRPLADVLTARPRLLPTTPTTPLKLPILYEICSST